MKLLTPATVPTAGLPLANNRDLARTLAHCFRRICSWRVPPNWSPWAWFEEIKAHGVAASCRAIREYDPTRGVPFNAFVYQRVMARVLTRHRQEWGYAMRFVSENDEQNVDIRSDVLTNGSDPYNPTVGVTQPPPYEALREAVASLPESHQWLITQLFWHGQTEADLARSLRISRRAVNKRKHVILQSLLAALKLSGPRTGEANLLSTRVPKEIDRCI
jgi:DNA-directed RNA polymerase specialized sigma subunit